MDFDNPKDITEKMKGGLARMYADEGFREYLLHSIQVANKGAMICLQKGDLEKGRVYADRFDWLKTLVDKGKECFVNGQKLKDN
jgi:hypothetical protein